MYNMYNVGRGRYRNKDLRKQNWDKEEGGIEIKT